MGYPDYYQVVERFLKELDGKKVNDVVLYAVTFDGEKNNVIVEWDGTACDLAMAAGAIQLQASAAHLEEIADSVDEEEEEEVNHDIG